MGANVIMKSTYDHVEPPWESKAAWQIVNRNLDYLIHRHHDALKHAVMLARVMEGSLKSIFILLDDLCSVTCPWCPTPCCLSAEVWIDFKDLVFLHLAGHPIPDRQLRSHLKKVCRCWRPKGCVLPRISRPWICTWYLCPTQKANLLRKSCDIRDKFSRQIQMVKDCRRKMEAEFIRVVS
jgi:hypothetical protein